jgi:molybdopterin synthase catalytic subunit
LQETAIRAAEMVEAVAQDGAGAVTLFVGTVRDHNSGRRVRYLEYHCYPKMARSEMARLEALALERFEISGVALVHRTGRLEIGETSVAIAVAAAHRDDAFRACRFLIDTLKKTVPIWKKEFYEGGDRWVEGM